jgi:hypothetical protein
MTRTATAAISITTIGARKISDPAIVEEFPATTQARSAVASSAVVDRRTFNFDDIAATRRCQSFGSATALRRSLPAHMLAQLDCRIIDSVLELTVSVTGRVVESHRREAAGARPPAIVSPRASSSRADETIQLPRRVTLRMLRSGPAAGIRTRRERHRDAWFEPKAERRSSPPSGACHRCRALFVPLRTKAAPVRCRQL